MLMTVEQLPDRLAIIMIITAGLPEIKYNSA